MQADTIQVEFSPVQQQAGSTDCGLFAIAFATDLAFGEDPVKISYQQCAMREHFAKCLQNENNFHDQSVQPTQVSEELPPFQYTVHAKCLSPWTVLLNVKHVISGFSITV